MEFAVWLLSIWVGLVGGVAPESATVQKTSFHDGLLLGVSSRPARMLVARQLSENKASLELVEADGKVKVRKEVVVPWSRAEEDSSKIPDAASMLKEHKLQVPVYGELGPDLVAMVSLRYEADRKVALMITSQGQRELKRFNRDEPLKLRVGWAPDKGLLVLYGYSGEEGFFQMEPIPRRSTALSKAQLEEAYLDECENFASIERFARVAKLANKAFVINPGARVLYYLALSHAYLQEWDVARGHLRRLENSKEKSAAEYLKKLSGFSVVREARLRGMDFNRDSGLTFHAPKGFEGTSVWLKIKDKSGRNVAAFKPSNGNTYHRGEIFTYQMSKLLGNDELYAVNILYELDKSGCKKLVKELESTTYKGVKETNRKNMIRACRDGKLEGTVKEWVSDFVFFGGIGTQKKLLKHGIFPYLTRDGGWPTRDRMVKIKQSTRLYKPDRCKEATYLGKISEWQLARDISDIMIMDVLNSNEDRFPGANLEFKSLGGARETSDCTFDFGPSRLFSLDNGATFKGTYSNGLVDFTKRVKISRFRKETYRRLKLMDQFIRGERTAPVFLRRFGITKVEELWKYLALDKGDGHKRRKEPHKLFITNLRAALGHMDRYLKDRYAWFD